MAAGRRKASGQKRMSTFIKKTRRRRRTVRKTIKRVRRRVSVARRRRRAPARRRSGGKGILSKIPLINNPTFRKAATGIGIATLGAAVLGIVAPSLASNALVRPVLALAGGGIPGVAAQIFTQGGLGGLTGILGGGNGATGGGSGATGFA